ncbi:MAG: pyridoxamine 5'-phosphate oxidase family protein [Microthrixaceae bacterium]
MSHAVDITELRTALDHYGAHAFLLTTNDEGRPHVSHITVELAGGVLSCDAGRKTGANAAVRPKVSLLWPAPQPGGFSLIVDGEATLVDDRLRIAPTGAIRHRPASTSGCDVDCEPLSGE